MQNSLDIACKRSVQLLEELCATDNKQELAKIEYLLKENEHIIHQLEKQRQLSNALLSSIQHDAFEKFLQLWDKMEDSIPFTALPHYTEILRTVIEKGDINAIQHVIDSVDSTNLDNNCKESAFECAILSNKLEVVKILLNCSIVTKHGLGIATLYRMTEVAQYLMEYDKDRFFDFDFQYSNVLQHAITQCSPSLTELVIKQYPQRSAREMVEGSLLETVFAYLDLGVIHILRHYFYYIDVNKQLPYTWRSSTTLHVAIEKTTGANVCKDELCQYVRLLIAYGADVDMKDKNSSLTARATLQELVKEGVAQYAILEAYDRAEKEGLEIWRWNQGVMKEVVKWSGCVMRGDLMGLGKHAVEVVVKFAPAQFEEKLELSTVRMLRAQMMLEMGHGVTFGDVHHGGYVKYAGTIGEGVTLHRWNATVTCDYHIDVKMKGVARIVQVSGDSYVDKAIEAKGVVSYVHVWGGDAYDQKLYAQQQWYVETGETLPTLAETQVGAQMEGIVTHSTSQRQHDVMHHMHDHAFRHISQVVVLPHPQQQHNHIEHSLELHDNSLHTSSQLIPHTTDFFSL